MQITDTILMVRPASFGYNAETAANNYFQNEPGGSGNSIQQQALHEFDQMVDTLKQHGISVVVIEDTKEPSKPDAIFPNNWLVTTPSGTLAIFPMFASNRRLEKRDDILHMLRDQFEVSNFQDWSEFEVDAKYLEGTGSMVFDHDHKIIYACLSPRTDISVLNKFAEANGYRAFTFMATDKKGRPVYHTNVVMALGEDVAVVCVEAIEEETEAFALCQLISTSGKTVVPITRDQMECFAGNLLEVKNNKGLKFLVMSKSAYECLSTDQVLELEQASFAELLPIPVPTIESVEGGSVRCMMAEIFLRKR